MPPDYLWDDSVGIYVAGVNGVEYGNDQSPKNYFRDWERPASIEYFKKSGNLAFNLLANVQLYGGATRKIPQKSMIIEAVDGKADYAIFKERNYKELNTFILRNSGNDWYDDNEHWGTMMRDA